MLSDDMPWGPPKLSHELARLGWTRRLIPPRPLTPWYELKRRTPDGSVRRNGKSRTTGTTTAAAETTSRSRVPLAVGSTARRTKNGTVLSAAPMPIRSPAFQPRPGRLGSSHRHTAATQGRNADLLI